MSQPPSRPKLYHITHVDNLSAIVLEGGLVSDAEMIRRGDPTQAIGMRGIKRRRVEELEVRCHPGTKVGDYVPFYFCPRSIMLFVIYRANHAELSYRGGQEPIIHLEADLDAVLEWARSRNLRCAFSLSNAGARYAEFRSQREELNQLDWAAIEATDFRDRHVSEGKQAEFLVYGRFPFEIVERIGVESPMVEQRVAEVLASAPFQPLIEVRREWYF